MRVSTVDIIRLVAAREIHDRLRNRGFLIGTAVTLVVMVAVVIGPSLLSDDDPASFDLGIVGALDPLFEQAVVSAAEAQDADLALRSVADRGAAEQLVEDGDVDAVLMDTHTLLVVDEVDGVLRTIVEQGRQQAALLGGLADAGVDLADADQLLAGRPPVEVLTTAGGTEDDVQRDQGLAVLATILLFLIIQINGSSLLTGTIEEKSSRVVEVLLGSVRPWQLLSGKLSGIMLLAMAQLALFVGVTLGANAAVGAFEVPTATAGALGVGLVMFVLGFAFYSSLYAVAGSMATSMEDAQGTAGPLSFLSVGAYMGTLVGVVPNPDSVFATVLSYLPPTAPFAVPARVAVGAMSPLAVAGAAVVTAVAAVLAVRLAGRLYSAAILSGGKLSWRGVLQAEPVR